MKHGITAATKIMLLTALLCVRAHRRVKIQTSGFARTSVLDDENGILRFLEGYDAPGLVSFTCYGVLANGISGREIRAWEGSVVWGVTIYERGESS